MQKPEELRTETQDLDLRARATYFQPGGRFDATIEPELRDMVVDELNRYFDRCRTDNLPASLLDFAVDLIYEVGRGDAFREVRIRRDEWLEALRKQP